MKSIYRWMTVFGLIAVLAAAGFSFATTQPVLAHDVSSPAFQTTPEPPTVVTQAPPAQQTVVVPNTGGSNTTVVFGNWWILALIAVLLIGLVIGLLARGSNTHIE